MDDGKMFKLSDVARMTGIPAVTLRLYARNGTIPAFRVGKLWRMTAQDIERMKERNAWGRNTPEDARQQQPAKGDESNGE